MEEIKEPTVFCFSGGRSSAYALYLMREELTKDDIIIFNNTGKEREETLLFVKKVSDKWCLPIIWLEYCPEKKFQIVCYDTAARQGEPFQKLINHKKGFIPNRVTRYCTEILKISPMKAYLKSIGIKQYKKILGIRYDEPERYHRLKDTAFMPLYKNKVTKAMVREFWIKQDFDLGLTDFEGNCDLCFLKSKKSKLTILYQNPEVADWWNEQEISSSSGSTFDERFSVFQLLEMSKRPFQKSMDYTELNQPTLFDADTINCYCGD